MEVGAPGLRTLIALPAAERVKSLVPDFATILSLRLEEQIVWVKRLRQKTVNLIHNVQVRICLNLMYKLVEMVKLWLRKICFFIHSRVKYCRSGNIHEVVIREFKYFAKIIIIIALLKENYNVRILNFVKSPQIRTRVNVRASKTRVNVRASRTRVNVRGQQDKG